MQRLSARLLQISGFVLALACACAMFGAIPWLSVPTSGQAVWASGFALSFANADALSIHATHFGLPHPAPIAFGLSATLVQAGLIRAFGIAAMDAYTLTAVLFLALSLWGARDYARRLGLPEHLALPLNLLWLALPIVVQHVGYSMVALGFALLPFYLSVLHRLVYADTRMSMVAAAVGFIASCVLSVFMDGYTFVMFALASALFLTGMLATGIVPRSRTLFHAVPCVAAGFGVAYVLYGAYVGHHAFRPVSLDFFRGWGVDVSMLLIPTRGMHWIWDVLGINSARSAHIYWGDASVWMTTFIAPLIITGLTGFAVTTERKYASILLAIAVAGSYLSLGPSLKFNSTKEVEGITSEESGQLMSAKFAVAPTGSAILSQHLPGFNLMRAAYRWAGLGALGLWALTVLLVLRLRSRHPVAATLIGPLAILLFLPHVGRVLSAGIANRNSTNAMESALVEDLRGIHPLGGVLFFAPHGNDFIVNYLAPLAGFRSYNIGGDKNVEMAQQYWSDPLKRLALPQLLEPTFPEDIRVVLLTGQADAVILPFFDTLWAPHQWPPSTASVANLRAQRLPIARNSADTPCFRLIERPLFVAVALTQHGIRVRDQLSDANMATATNEIPHCLTDQ